MFKVSTILLNIRLSSSATGSVACMDGYVYLLATDDVITTTIDLSMFWLKLSCRL